MDAAHSTPTPSIRRESTILARVIRLVPLGMALALFLAIALHQLHLPGFYYDEALDLVPMLHVMRGEQPELLRAIGVGRFPIMLLDYMGSLNGYITIPFMRGFGAGYMASRAEPIFFSCVTIVLTWLLARRWFGNGVAAVSVLLLAVNPSFIWFSRQGISVTSVMTVFSLGSLLVIGNWLSDSTNTQHPTKSFVLLLFAGLLLGLGLWAKFLFFRWIAVLIVMGVIFFFARRRRETEKRSLRMRLVSLSPCLLVLLAGFLLGAAPLIYYNVAGLVRDGQPWTLALLFNSLLHPTQQFGVNNADFAHNLQKSLDDVRVFIDGSYFWYNGVPFSNVYAVPALLIAVVVGGVLALARVRRTPHPSPLPAGEGVMPSPFRGRVGEGVRFFALLAAMLTLIVLGAFTVSGLWSTHQFIMLPLPQMIVACAVVWLSELISSSLTGKKGKTKTDRISLVSPLFQVLLVSAILALPFSRDLWVNEQHHNTLATTGGSGRFSDAVYKLAGWLDENKINQPIALDWGIEKQVRVLTGDRVRPIEIFGYSAEADDAFRQRATQLLADESRSYIVLWDRFAVYNRRQAFTEIANAMGKQVVETYIAHEKSGLPVYVVLQAKAK